MYIVNCITHHYVIAIMSLQCCFIDNSLRVDCVFDSFIHVVE